MKAKLFFLIFIVILCIPAILPLFRQGFFQSDDGEWMIIRFSAFHQALRDGQLPIRFLGRLNHEYGYPVANFLYPGSMYVAEIPKLLGFGFVDTIKIIFGVSMVGSAIFCYLWLSKFFNKLSSSIGALFYLYTPYHLFDLYKRGSIGEVLAIAVIPFILWQIERRSFFWVSISIAFLIISHNTLAVLFLPIIIVYSFIKNLNQLNRHSGDSERSVEDSRISNGNKRFWTSQNDGIVSVALGLGVSAFFWIPAFFELQYTVFSQTQVSEWQNYFVGVDLIGLSTVAIFVAAFLLFVKPLYSSSERRESRSFNKNSSRQARTINFEVGYKLTIIFFVVGLLSIFFASSLSNLLWKILPVAFIQFPFRFLSLTIVCISFLAACVISTSPNKLKIPVVVLSLIILSISAQPFITPLKFFDKGDAYYSTNEATTTVQDEYMPKWVKEKPVERYVEKVEIVEGIGKVKNIVYNSKKITFNIGAKNDMKVRINTIYYPGWKAIAYSLSCHPDQAKPEKDLMRFFAPLSGSQNDRDCVSKELTIDYQNDKGVMELELPKGENKVALNFSETPLRLFADFFSIFSFIALIFIAKPACLSYQKWVKLNKI